jgi:membrane associated rhomboid family serine protease
MNAPQASRFGVAAGPVYLVCAIWAVYLADFIIPGSLNSWGIAPRTLRGLAGIVSSNFLHANFGHIVSNTVPLFVLSLLLTLFHHRLFVPVTVTVMLVGGLLVWLLGRSGNHIGASMLIYGLAAFLISHGLLKKAFIPALVALFVAVVYGWGLLGGLLPHGFISWEGHLFGAVGGVVAARLPSITLLDRT